jgi:hypothetical protein
VIVAAGGAADNAGQTDGVHQCGGTIVDTPTRADSAIARALVVQVSTCVSELTKAGATKRRKIDR